MSSIQLVLLTSLAGDTTSIQSGTLINTDEATAAKLLEHRYGRRLLKHEPTDEQLSKAIDFVDDDGSKNTDPNEFDGEDSTDDAGTETGADGDDTNPQRSRRRTRSKPDAS